MKSEPVARERRSPLQWLEWMTTWFLQIWCIVMIAAAAWLAGGVHWRDQLWFLYGGLVMGVVLVIHWIARACIAKSIVRTPRLAILICFLAVYTIAQSLPVFRASGTMIEPYSVRLQRWFLGEPITVPAGVALQSNVQQALANAESETDDNTNGAAQTRNSEDRFLAISVEPQATRAATASLVVIGLMILTGASVYRDRQSQVFLFAALTTIGIAMASMLLLQSIAWQKHRSIIAGVARSYGTFHSKNSVGAFLNVGLAASVGLAVWAFSKKTTFRSDSRYSYPMRSMVTRLRHMIEETFRDLETLQIASLVLVMISVAAVFASLCRGATIAAGAAALLTFILINGKRRSAGTWIAGLVIVLVVMGFLFFFEIDDKISDRFSSLTQDGLQSEVGRRYIWEISFAAGLQYLFTGSGLGTFHYAYLPFQSPRSMGWYYHAESLFAEAFVELGWLGIGAIAVGVTIIVMQLKELLSGSKGTGATAIGVAGVFLLISQVLHSTVDFQMIIPAVFLPSALMMGVVSGEYTRCMEWKANRSRTKGSRRGSHRNGTPTSLDVSGDRIEALSSLGQDESSESSNESPMHRAPSKVNGSTVVPPVKSSSIGALCGLILLIAIFSTCGALAHSSLEQFSRVEDVESFLKKQSPDTQDGSADLTIEDLDNAFGARIDDTVNPELLHLASTVSAYEYHRQLAAQFQHEYPDHERRTAWLNTKPLIARMSHLARDRHHELDRFWKQVINEENTDAADLAADLAHAGRYGSPLNWQLIWDEMLYDMAMDKAKQRNLLTILSPLMRNRPDTLIDCGILANAAGQTDLAIAYWHNAVDIYAAGYFDRVANLVDVSFRDGEIPMSVFPRNPDILVKLIKRFPKKVYPKTSEDIQLVAEEVAESMPEQSNRKLENYRLLLQATVKREKGKFGEAAELFLKLSQNEGKEPEYRFAAIESFMANAQTLIQSGQELYDSGDNVGWSQAMEKASDALGTAQRVGDNSLPSFTSSARFKELEKKIAEMKNNLPNK